MIEQLIRLADVVKASDEDVRWLYGSAPLTHVLAEWAAMGPTVCAVTQGGSEVVVLAAGTIEHFPTLPTTVVDTVGAGDSFMAGLISGLLDLGPAGGRRRARAPALRPVAGHPRSRRPGACLCSRHGVTGGREPAHARRPARSRCDPPVRPGRQPSLG